MSEPDQPETPPPPPPAPAPPPPPQYGAYQGGYPPPPVGYPAYTPPPIGPSNGLGTASLVVAIVALITLVGGVVLGVVAVILGFLGWGRAKRGEANNGGVAVAGIVLGFLSIIEAVAVIAFAVWGFDRAGGSDYLECLSNAGAEQQAIQQCIDRFTDKVENELSITITPTP